jgi:hypothetical protein
MSFRTRKRMVKRTDCLYKYIQISMLNATWFEISVFIYCMSVLEIDFVLTRPRIKFY